MSNAALAAVETPEETEAFARITRKAPSPSRIGTFPLFALSSAEDNEAISSQSIDADIAKVCIDVGEHTGCIQVCEDRESVGLAAHIVRCIAYCAGLTEQQLTEQNAVQVIAGGIIDADASNMHFRQALKNGDRAVKLEDEIKRLHEIIKRAITDPSDSDAVADIFLQPFGLARADVKAAA